MKILYFTKDFSPENVAFAKDRGLVMRMADAVESAANPEACDAVCGEVPALYAALPVHDLQGAESAARRKKA